MGVRQRSIGKDCTTMLALSKRFDQIRINPPVKGVSQATMDKINNLLADSTFSQINAIAATFAELPVKS